jgi:hypothetical protein
MEEKPCINGSHCRHVREEKGKESHGISWKVMEILRERKMYIITA